MKRSRSGVFGHVVIPTVSGRVLQQLSEADLIGIAEIKRDAAQAWLIAHAGCVHRFGRRAPRLWRMPWGELFSWCPGCGASSDLVDSELPTVDTLMAWSSVLSVGVIEKHADLFFDATTGTIAPIFDKVVAAIEESVIHCELLDAAGTGGVH